MACDALSDDDIIIVSEEKPVITHVIISSDDDSDECAFIFSEDETNRDISDIIEEEKCPTSIADPDCYIEEVRQVKCELKISENTPSEGISTPYEELKQFKEEIEAAAADDIDGDDLEHHEMNAVLSTETRELQEREKARAKRVRASQQQYKYLYLLLCLTVHKLKLCLTELSNSINLEELQKL